MVGLGSTLVHGFSSANISVQPQFIFRPNRLVVPSNIAPDFLITDIKIGKKSQFNSVGCLPATMFTEFSFGVLLKMDVTQISMFVTISVTNQNREARNFQGALLGPMSVEEDDPMYGDSQRKAMDCDLFRRRVASGVLLRSVSITGGAAIADRDLKALTGR